MTRFFSRKFLASKKSSGSDSDTDSGDSDSGSESDASSESLLSSGSGSSFFEKAANDGYDSDSDSDTDIEMDRPVRRRPYPSTPANKNGPKSMQDKVLEEVQKKLVSDKQANVQENTELMAMCKRACDMRDELLDKIHELGDRLPSNTLDQLVEELGGPDEVAVSE